MVITRSKTRKLMAGSRNVRHIILDPHRSLRIRVLVKQRDSFGILSCAKILEGGWSE